MAQLRGKRPAIANGRLKPVEALCSEYALEQFVIELAKDLCCDKSKACKKAGIKHVDLPRILAEYPEFAAKVAAIDEDFNSRLEAKAAERAFAGSDTLIRLLLERRMPDKYGPAARVTVDVNVDEIREMTTEQLEELRCRLLKS